MFVFQLRGVPALDVTCVLFVCVLLTSFIVFSPIKLLGYSYPTRPISGRARPLSGDKRTDKATGKRRAKRGIMSGRNCAAMLQGLHTSRRIGRA